MAKNSTLSSDIDIIKEFEELKLKQKLLIDSLSRNTESSQNKLFLEINSKLDFLVKIFTESSNNAEEEGKIDYEAKFNEVLDKISNLSQNLDDKVISLEEKISEVKNSENEIVKKIDSEKTQREVKISEVKDVSKDVEKSDLPPIPDFETKIDEAQKSEEVEKKKKKWF